MQNTLIRVYMLCVNVQISQSVFSMAVIADGMLPWVLFGVYMTGKYPVVAFCLMLAQLLTDGR